jgi:hypothetical protein
MALKFANEERNKAAVIFARDKPRPDNIKMRMKYRKEYMVGSLQRFFKYGWTAPTGEVALDEVVRSGEPSPLHFDIEIKKVDHLEGRDVEAVLRTQVEAFGLEEGDYSIHDVSRDYKRIAVSPLTEEECQAGFGVVRRHILQMVKRIIPDYPDMNEWGEDMMVVTGCRASKFSLHVVMKRIFCDSAVLAMPLVVFEIAREFAIANTKEVLSRRQRDGEWRFRVRALMLESLAEVQEGVPIFKGFDDSPFDEAIYSANHLLRAPGACKAAPGVGGLAPVLGETTRMIVGERRFDVIFPDSPLWMDHCICSRLKALDRPPLDTPASDSFVLTRWEPKPAYPRARRWWAEYRKLGAVVGLDSLFDHVIECAETLGRYQELRLTRREQRLLNRDERQLACRDLGEGAPKELVDADDIFRCEDGKRKAFRCFHPGEFLFHVHGGVEESTPSAKTFRGGFHCFGCNNTYGTLRTRAWEENFPFLEDEITEAEEADAYLPAIQWVDLQTRKFCVVSAPMGSGKTEQVISLVNQAVEEEKRVCVVSFRRFLAQQQAVRLGVKCYLEMSDEDIRSCDMLTICVNSLSKLGTQRYQTVILDECGLIRRHFLSTVCVNVLGKVYDRFVQLIREASFVVMLQDGVSREDVQFYTEIDSLQCDDRSRLSAQWFKKPIKIHPIQYTTEMFTALLNLENCYRRSFDHGVCTQPFMVFCSSVTYAEFLLERLQSVAQGVEGADPERVKCICGATKTTDPFCRAFAREPNENATSADVVIATSVLGAGFSIRCHFVAFHAFLFTGILNHGEENQFIRRLRFIMDHTPAEAFRQSYLFLQKGHGAAVEYTAVLKDFRVVRQLLLQYAEEGRRAPSIAVLEQTQARLATERAVTRAKHDDLWIEWGETIDSEFLEMPGCADDELKELKSVWYRWTRQRKQSIGDRVRGDVEDVGETLEQLEAASGMSLFRHSLVEAKVVQLTDAFTSPKVALGLIKRLFCKNSEEECKSFLGSRKLSITVNRCRSLVCWLSWVYRDLNPERCNSMWNVMEKKRYHTGNLQATARYRLSEHITRDMFIHLNSEAPRGYLRDTGMTPFFTGASVIEDRSLCEFLRLKLEENTENTENSENSENEKKHKANLRSCVMTLAGKSTSHHEYINDLYDQPKEALKFAKLLIKSLGMVLKTTDKRIIHGTGDERRRKQEMQIPKDILALALALKKQFSQQLVELLPTLLGTANLSNIDKEWVRESIEAYNEECATAGEAGLQIHCESEGNVRSAGVISARVHEANAEWAVGGNTTTSRHQDECVAAARAILHLQSTEVDKMNAHIEQVSHQRHLNQARVIEDDDDAEDEDDDDDDGNVYGNGNSNGFVLDEAED